MSDYLVHHGVLGMKWGVRKQKETSNIKAPKKKKESLLTRYVRGVENTTASFYGNLTKGQRIATYILAGLGSAASSVAFSRMAGDEDKVEIGARAIESMLGAGVAGLAVESLLQKKAKEETRTPVLTEYQRRRGITTDFGKYHF